MKMLEGELRETRYAWPTSDPERVSGGRTTAEDEAPMEETGKKALLRDSVAYINGIS